MKNLVLILVIPIVLLFNYQALRAQNVITTSGGNAISSNGSASYTIGQVFYNTYSVAEASIAQGVQQPFELSVVTVVSEESATELNCSIYPNPASDNITLKVENFSNKKMEFELYNYKAILVKKEKILSFGTNIDLSAFSSSVYILKIIENDIPMANYRIIKNY